MENNPYPNVAAVVAALPKVTYYLEEEFMVEWAMYPAFDFYLLAREGILQKAVDELLHGINDNSEEAQPAKFDFCETVTNYLEAYVDRKQGIDRFDFNVFGKKEGRHIRQALNRELLLLRRSENQAEAHRRITDLENKKENVFLFGVNLLEAIYIELECVAIKGLEAKLPSIAYWRPEPDVPDFFLAFSTKEDYVITEGDYAFARRQVEEATLKDSDLPLDCVQEKGGPKCKVYEPFSILLNASILPYKNKVWHEPLKHPDFLKVGGFICGKGYRRTYVAAYQKGVDYFRDNYVGEPSTLYGANGKAFATTIEKLYYETGKDGEQGWNYVKRIGENNDWMNRPLGNAFVEEVGYYTGVATECESFIREHSSLFTQQRSTENSTTNLLWKK